MAGIAKTGKARAEIGALDALEDLQGLFEGAMLASMRLILVQLVNGDVKPRDLTVLIRTLVEKYKDISELKAVVEGDVARATSDLERRSRELLHAAQELVRRQTPTDITPIEQEETDETFT